MAKREWTSNTLPELPESERVGSGLSMARWQARSDLLRAEEVERQARALRGIANQSVEHFRSLLEAAVTEPLFEVDE